MSFFKANSKILVPHRNILIVNWQLLVLISVFMLKKLRWSIAQQVELWWWNNYLKNKTLAQYHQWKNNYWKKFLEELSFDNKIDLSSNTILDIGCGPAGIFMLFQEASITAVDPLILKYEERLSHFKREFYPNVKFISKSLENFESDSKFNFIFCLNAINHVNDITLSIENLSKLLATNGQLIVSVDAHKHNWLKNIFQIIPGDILHPHQYNLMEYCKFLTDNNLGIHKKILFKEGNIFDYYVIIAS